DKVPEVACHKRVALPRALVRNDGSHNLVVNSFRKALADEPAESFYNALGQGVLGDILGMENCMLKLGAGDKRYCSRGGIGVYGDRGLSLLERQQPSFGFAFMVANLPFELDTQQYWAGRQFG